MSSDETINRRRLIGAGASACLTAFTGCSSVITRAQQDPDSEMARGDNPPSPVIRNLMAEVGIFRQIAEKSDVLVLIANEGKTAEFKVNVKAMSGAVPFGEETRTLSLEEGQEYQDRFSFNTQSGAEELIVTVNSTRFEDIQARKVITDQSSESVDYTNDL
jgi:hypothetical protein